MAFDPKTNQVQDFGLGVPNEGVNSGAYDPQFERIYGLTHPRGHFDYYAVKPARVVDKGCINNLESICRTLGIDDEGNVYGSFGAGQIFEYDLRTDAIQELSVRVPTREKGISLGRDYFQTETAWRTLVLIGRRGSFTESMRARRCCFPSIPGPVWTARCALGQLSIPGLKTGVICYTRC
jgi:hypothetical protein